MPGQPSPTIMDKDAANGVDFCLREICDDACESLTVSAPILDFELEQTDLGNLEGENWAAEDCIEHAFVI